MKTKLLSVFLVLAMLMTSVLCVLPASAVEADYDALAKAEGYVCRVGDPNADFTGYYKFFSAADTGYTEDQPNALVAALGAGNEATITLIDTINVSQQVSSSESTKYLHGSVVVRSGKKLTVDGNGQTYNTKWSFRADGGEITVKNCNIALANGATESYGDVRGNGALTYENCTFSAVSNTGRDGSGYFIAPNLTATATMTLKNCTVNIKDDTSKGGAIFWCNAGSFFTLNLDNVKVDASAYGSKAGFVMDGGNLSITGGSDIKVGGNAINAANVTIADSSLTTVTASFGNVFNYGSKSFAINVNLLNATLTAAKNVFDISGCKAGVNASLDGTTVLNAKGRALSVINNTCTVKVTASGSTELRGNGGESNTVYVCGKDANANFTLILQDNAKLISAKDGISFEHGSSPITKATIALLDRASVQTGSDCTFMKASTNVAEKAITYIRSDRATVTAKTELGSAGKFGKTIVYTPEMKFGASVRIVPDAENSNGLRFTSMLVNNATPTRYGTLIVKAADLGDTEFTIAALTAANIKFANIVATEEGTVKGDDKTTYNAALVNLPDAEFTTEFAARAYAVYTIDGTEYIVYSDFTAKDNVRSLVNVAEAALNDTKSTQSEEYCYKIAEDVYSPYTPAQYEVLKAYAAKKN